ncbi:hypothetical protein GQ43DRAFT_263924 [Delitschia confertaspora ATCC 74209]|uniref:Uncharacterized protein n=1 Tax=Delitschia confertaspora ATCC 74209 TaxID=1513339 RepID=A0A9P4JGZ1_9PLEO|nr:hypothetical protein GQ43DRAFT_263924 [Delitschia confertaspora ATCC 74209]
MDIWWLLVVWESARSVRPSLDFSSSPRKSRQPGFIWLTMYTIPTEDQCCLHSGCQRASGRAGGSAKWTILILLFCDSAVIDEGRGSSSDTYDSL